MQETVANLYPMVIEIINTDEDRQCPSERYAH